MTFIFVNCLDNFDILTTRKHDDLFIPILDSIDVESKVVMFHLNIIHVAMWFVACVAVTFWKEDMALELFVLCS